MIFNTHRGVGVVAALLAGFLVGLFAGAYIYSTWLATDSIIQGASPKHLNYDPTYRSPQYRDFYAVRAATLYMRELQAGLPNPVQSAYDVLGVTTGDTMIDEAIAMVSWARDIAQAENANDQNLGKFSNDEELALGNLAIELERARVERSYPVVDTATYAPAVTRTNNRILGGLLLVLMTIVAGALVWFVDRSTGFTRNSVETTHTVTAPRTATFITPEPAEPAGDVNIYMNAMPAAAGTVDMGVAAPAPVIATRSAPGEVQLSPYPPTIYQHGDETYDQGFTINSTIGELLAECGVSIADRLGVDSPARVNALSVWVFDKSDFKSTTKILMTPNALADPVIQAKLRSRGELVLARDGDIIDITTTAVRVEVRVSDLVISADSYFQSARFTFTAYQRQV